jgi:hypothetical protein
MNALNDGLDAEMGSFIRSSLNEVSNRRSASTTLKTEIDKGVQRTSVFVPSNPDPLNGPRSNNSVEVFGGGGGASGTFLASYSEDTGETSVTGGYYGILNTFTEVSPKTGTGGYVYAIIRHSNAGVFESFALEITSSVKNPTNLDGTGKFVQFSNVLLAAVIGSSVTQYRTGNFVLIHQLVNGRVCLWTY